MRKIALIFVMIFLICCMTACENKGTVQETSSITNTKNTSNTELTLQISIWRKKINLRTHMLMVKQLVIIL